MEIQPTLVAEVAEELVPLEFLLLEMLVETVELDYNQILQEPIPIMQVEVVEVLGLIFLEILTVVQAVQVAEEMVENTMITHQHKLLELQTQAEVAELLELQMAQ